MPEVAEHHHRQALPLVAQESAEGELVRDGALEVVELVHAEVGAAHRVLALPLPLGPLRGGEAVAAAVEARSVLQHSYHVRNCEVPQGLVLQDRGHALRKRRDGSAQDGGLVQDVDPVVGGRVGHRRAAQRLGLLQAVAFVRRLETPGGVKAVPGHALADGLVAAVGVPPVAHVRQRALQRRERRVGLREGGARELLHRVAVPAARGGRRGRRTRRVHGGGARARRRGGTVACGQARACGRVRGTMPTLRGSTLLGEARGVLGTQRGQRHARATGGLGGGRRAEGPVGVAAARRLRCLRRHHTVQ
mmetsp:Transcript_38394/g.118624  ORF Transcript_38394/g.118624 Transcript_38394/m.118624 type:complete len:305 (-) Transcript_38394:204-1118(-)